MYWAGLNLYNWKFNYTYFGPQKKTGRKQIIWANKNKGLADASTNNIILNNS